MWQEKRSPNARALGADLAAYRRARSADVAELARVWAADAAAMAQLDLPDRNIAKQEEVMQEPETQLKTPCALRYVKSGCHRLPSW